MRTMSPLLLAALLLAAPLAVDGAPNDSRHVRTALEPVDGSGVKGIVDISSVPRGGSYLLVVVNGVQHDSLYAVYVDRRANCEPRLLFVRCIAQKDLRRASQQRPFGGDDRLILHAALGQRRPRHLDAHLVDRRFAVAVHLVPALGHDRDLLDLC